jgi:hypothetical protein
VVLAKDVSSNPGQLGQDIKQTQAATTNALVPYMKPGSTLYNNTNWIDSGAGQSAVRGAQQVLNVAPAVGNAVALSKDIATGQLGNMGQDIKQTQAATTNALVPYMKPGSTLYNNTNWIDSGAGQTAVKGAQQVLNVAPAVGNAVTLSKDIATGQLGNMGQDIKQTQAATTNALTPYMMPGSALYKATDVIDTAGGQLTVRAANGVLSTASKLPSWLNSVSPP